MRPGAWLSLVDLSFLGSKGLTSSSLAEIDLAALQDALSVQPQDI